MSDSVRSASNVSLAGADKQRPAVWNATEQAYPPKHPAGEASVVVAHEVENPAIIPIQPQGSKPPLFWVRGGFPFVPLARHLGSDQPILGIYLPPTEARHLPVPCMFEDIAAALVRLMRKSQPEGPYYIAGLCVNGVIAYEMACQLRTQGQQVALLALFDAQNPKYFRDFSRASRLRMVQRKIEYHLANLRRLKTDDMAEFLFERFVGIGRRLKALRWRAHHVLKLQVSRQQLENPDTIIHPASYFYQPKNYSGRVVFFQSTDWPAGSYWDFATSWNGLVFGSLEVHYIAGGHQSMFEQPNVDTLGSKLEACLSEAQRSYGGVRVATEGSVANAITNEKLPLSRDTAPTMPDNGRLKSHADPEACRTDG